MSAPLLEVDRLAVEFAGATGSLRVVDEISFTLAPGEMVGLVGESGCGKSATAAALVRLLPPGGRIAGGRVLWRGQDLAALRHDAMRERRGRELAWMAQEPAAALDPAFTVGAQIEELLQVHRGLARGEAKVRAEALLAELGVADPAARMRAQAHELSGGQRQRVALALALAGDPALLIADEPTSSLDAAVQLQVLEFLGARRRERGLAVLLISHDLPLVAAHCDRVLVMYAGRLVESGPARALLDDPRHPYTKALLAAQPPLRPLARGERLGAIPGHVPAPSEWPSGCRFHPRCGKAIPACQTVVPPLKPLDEQRAVACPVVMEPPR